MASSNLGCDTSQGRSNYSSLIAKPDSWPVLTHTSVPYLIVAIVHLTIYMLKESPTLGTKEALQSTTSNPVILEQAAPKQCDIEDNHTTNFPIQGHL